MGKVVLVTDDSMFMRSMLKKILIKSGYDVAFASDGFQAIEKYKELKPDIVTLDITMPNMDGLTALKQIMSIDPNASVVMCSAMGQQAMVMEAIKSGAKDFVVKPFQEDRVLESISKITR